MYCNDCGAANPDDAVFCSSCGHPVVRATTGPAENVALRGNAAVGPGPVPAALTTQPLSAEPAVVAAAVTEVADSDVRRVRAHNMRVWLVALAVGVIGGLLFYGWTAHRERQREAAEEAARSQAAFNGSSKNVQVAGTSEPGQPTATTTAPAATGAGASTLPPPPAQPGQGVAAASLNFPPDTSDADAVQCDRLATHPTDPQRTDGGVVMEAIDIAQALPACERAASRAPARPRYQYEYGRVLEAASRYDQAVNQYALAERAGYAMGDFNLGLAYTSGRGVTRNRDSAIAFLLRADAASVKNAKASIGDAYMYITPPDYDHAKGWYEVAVDQREPQGYSGLGTLYDFGLGVARDHVKGAELQKQAAELGSISGMYWAGLHYKDGRGVDKDPATACRWFDKAAREGHAAAQFEVGSCYYTGADGDRNHQSAFYWLIRAARADVAQAQELVGDMYDSGDGVGADEAQAVTWYRKAAEQNDAYGMMQLGAHLRQGKGVAWSEADAMRWFEKAAKTGYAAAQSSLAEGYLIGLGQNAGQGHQDYQQAAYWFGEAAKQGEGFAQLNLGVMYENGWGVTQDVERAKQLYAQAGQSSNAGAAKAGKDYLAALSSAATDTQTTQTSRVNKPSNADGWIGLIATVIAVGAVAELVSHWSSGSSRSDGKSTDTSDDSSSSVNYVPDYTPPSIDWNWGSSEPIAPIAPTRPDLYYPNEPLRPVNGDLTDPRIATR